MDFSQWLLVVPEQVFALSMGGVGGVLFLGLKERLEAPLRLLQRRDDRLEARRRAALATNHRVANAVMAAALQADALAQRAAGTPLSSGLEQTCQHLSRVAALVSQTRDELVGSVPDDVEVVDWAPVVAAFAGRRGFGVDVAEAPCAGVLCVQGEAGLLRILEELADNVPAGASASVQVRPHDEVQVTIGVVDDGPGLTMPPGQAREAFVTGRPDAAGLGLLVVDCLAKASGARLELQPRPHRGTFAGVRFLGDAERG